MNCKNKTECETSNIPSQLVTAQLNSFKRAKTNSSLQVETLKCSYSRRYWPEWPLRNRHKLFWILQAAVTLTLLLSDHLISSIVVLIDGWTMPACSMTSCGEWMDTEHSSYVHCHHTKPLQVVLCTVELPYKTLAGISLHSCATTQNPFSRVVLKGWSTHWRMIQRVGGLNSVLNSRQLWSISLYCSGRANCLRWRRTKMVESWNVASRNGKDEKINEPKVSSIFSAASFSYPVVIIQCDV